MFVATAGSQERTADKVRSSSPLQQISGLVMQGFRPAVVRSAIVQQYYRGYQRLLGLKSLYDLLQNCSFDCCRFIVLPVLPRSLDTAIMLAGASPSNFFDSNASIFAGFLSVDSELKDSVSRKYVVVVYFFCNLSVHVGCWN